MMRVERSGRLGSMELSRRGLRPRWVVRSEDVFGGRSGFQKRRCRECPVGRKWCGCRRRRGITHEVCAGKVWKQLERGGEIAERSKAICNPARMVVEYELAARCRKLGEEPMAAPSCVHPTDDYLSFARWIDAYAGRFVDYTKADSGDFNQSMQGTEESGGHAGWYRRGFRCSGLDRFGSITGRRTGCATGRGYRVGRRSSGGGNDRSKSCRRLGDFSGQKSEPSWEVACRGDVDSGHTRGGRF
jgi:hypothetical protein